MLEQLSIQIALINFIIFDLKSFFLFKLQNKQNKFVNKNKVV